MKIKAQSFISVIVPFVEKPIVTLKYVRDLAEFLIQKYEDHEIILIGPSSKLSTCAELSSLLSDVPFVRVLYLRNEGTLESQYAIAAESAIGDFVACMHPLNDPIKELPKLTSMLSGSVGIIVGTSSVKKSISYRILGHIFRSSLKKLQIVQLPSNGTNFNIISRDVLNSIFSKKTNPDYFYFYLFNSGYQFLTYSYNLKTSFSIPEKKLLEGYRRAFRILVHSSTSLLHYVNLLGLVGSFLGLLMSLYSILVNIINNQVVEGWTTIILFISFQFSILFLVLFFFGEYLARLIDQNSQQSESSISFEKNSSVMGLASTWNISTDEVQKS